MGHTPLQGNRPPRLSVWEQTALLSTLSKTRQEGAAVLLPGVKEQPCPAPLPWQPCTSVGMLGTEPVKPFSAMVLWELLGELGPEPGALLHTDDTTGKWPPSAGPAPSLQQPVPPGPQNRDGRGVLTPRPGTCDLHSSLFKGADDSPVLAAQEGTASPLSHLLL